LSIITTHSRENLRALLALGIHAVRLATKLQPTFLGGVSAWVWEDGKFRSLSDAEVNKYVSLSESIDAAVLAKLSSSG
jgi:hypothetical protein